MKGGAYLSALVPVSIPASLFCCSEAFGPLKASENQASAVLYI